MSSPQPSSFSINRRPPLLMAAEVVRTSASGKILTSEQFSLPFVCPIDVEVKGSAVYASHLPLEFPGISLVAGRWLFANLDTINVRIQKIPSANAKVGASLVSAELSFPGATANELDHAKALSVLESYPYAQFDFMQAANTAVESYSFDLALPAGVSDSCYPPIPPLHRLAIAVFVRSTKDEFAKGSRIVGVISGTVIVSGIGHMAISP